MHEVCTMPRHPQIVLWWHNNGKLHLRHSNFDNSYSSECLLLKNNWTWSLYQINQMVFDKKYDGFCYFARPNDTFFWIYFFSKKCTETQIVPDIPAMLTSCKRTYSFKPECVSADRIKFSKEVFGKKRYMKYTLETI